ncbi:hypothetical protein MC885_016293 [Smutsia gigantea]|nr:hypothetical protein MC885_016293 [Smutsia gigantea]
MGTSSFFLCILFLCGALGLTSSPAQGKLCYPVLKNCQDHEACGISTGTSEWSEIMEQKGCLPRAQCPLLDHATYWTHSCTLWHHCCEQDLCKAAPTLRQLPSPLLTTLLLLAASFTWGCTSRTSLKLSAVFNPGLLLHHHHGPGNTCTDPSEIWSKNLIL